MRPRIVIPTDWESEPGKMPRAVLRRSYYQLVLAHGGLPVLAPPLQEFSDGLAADYQPDGLLLTGGADLDPSRFGQARHAKATPLEALREQAEFAWFDWADRRALPVLGICLGCQVINVARGGSLIQYLPDCSSPITHSVTGGSGWHDAAMVGPRLRGLIGDRAANINSRHRQAVDRLGRNLLTAAQAPDGTIEAVESTTPQFVLGIQWHLEDLPEHPATRPIVEAFIQAAREHAQEH